MIWVTVLLALLFALAAIIYVILPLRRPATPLPDPQEDELATLVARKDATLRAIKETEFDYRTGKLNEEDFQRDDGRLRRQALALLQQIDKRAPDSGELDTEIEAAVAKLRKRTPRKPQPAASATGFCHECGQSIQPDDKFCSKCGTPVRQAVASP